jgi:serine/threonine-protein kinase
MSIDVPRLTAALEGRYTIERELGEGGMAIVYLADDLKHDRKVALKVLKPELASVVGGERFISEIRTTANLQHPHILPLFDSGEADSFLFYVMPYVEGETLRDRLDREKQLPVKEAVDIARKVAGALQAAHDQGVIHRDIKPANILLQKGEPVVSDFGIALAVAEAGGGRLTETGLSLGTPYYMAPEQATGDRDPDARSDLYSLASVLYEMLAGEPPFTGGTAQAVLGRILTSDPTPINETRRAVSPDLDAVVLHALEKTPADRFPSMAAWADALGRVDLSWSGSHTTAMPATTGARGSQPAAGGAARSGARVWQISTGVLLAATAALAFANFAGGTAATERTVRRFELLLPVEIGANSDWGSNIAISPDGRRIAYSGMHDGASSPGLWVREADELEPVSLTGTTLGVHPTFSPDGSRIAFISDDRALKVASLEGRPPVTLHQDPWLRRSGVSWGDDGYIYFGQWNGEAGNTVIFRIPEDGGEIEQLTSIDDARGEVAHYFPDVLPGAEWMIVTIARDELYDASTRDIGITRIGSGVVTPIFEGMQAVWSDTGHIIVVRGDGALLASEWDGKSSTTGPLVPVFEGVQVESLASADFAVASDGTLIYVPLSQEGAVSPVWINRQGLESPVDPAWRTSRVADPRISPDGRFVAYSSTGDPQWVTKVKELDDGPETTLSAEGAINIRPAWTPDSRSVAWVTSRLETNSLVIRPADGSLPSEFLITSSGDRNLDEVAFSPDGEWIVAQVNDDIYIKSTDSDSDLEPLLAEPGVIEGDFAISPDGRWLAYVSTESGQSIVYVRPFPNVDDGRTVVSTRAARAPRWAPDMSELYYRTLSGDFMAAELSIGAGFAVRVRTPLFPFLGLQTSGAFAQYDVHPDGDRFFMVRLGDGSGRTPVVVVDGFDQELRDVMGEGR